MEAGEHTVQLLVALAHAVARTVEWGLWNGAAVALMEEARRYSRNRGQKACRAEVH
jgi:hypothetical protein